jgi:hypothetical protein
MTAPAPTFDFSLANDGSKSVTPGQSIASTITATLNSGSSQAVSFSTAGLPSGATAPTQPQAPVTQPVRVP